MGAAGAEMDTQPPEYPEGVQVFMSPNQGIPCGPRCSMVPRAVGKRLSGVLL